MTWVGYALLSAASAAIATICAKIGVRRADPAVAATIRSIIAAIFLITMSFSLKKIGNGTLANASYLEIGFIMLAGIAGGFSWIFYLYALKTGPALQVATLDRLSIVFILILSALIFGETLYAKQVIGALLIVLGMYFVAY